jgi:hypothetical protein
MPNFTSNVGFKKKKTVKINKVFTNCILMNGNIMSKFNEEASSYGTRQNINTISHTH